jgi:argininosuccinate lyase
MELQAALLERAEADFHVLMPGYTHLQRAQPILLSHWWLSHFWPLQRDRQRLGELRVRTGWLPLGSGALAGVPFQIDRQALLQELGFSRLSPNSIDAVSDRDFAAEFLFWSALTGVHLSRLAEGVILFSTAEFGYFELSDSYATGSSLMPQKKNPDLFELARGKAGGLVGGLCGLLTTLKGLPSAYDKDLQEDKMPVFQAYDVLEALFPVLAGALRTLSVHLERMRAGIEPGLMATDLADYLVRRGVPFRQAHQTVGKAIQLAEALGKTLDQLSLEEFQTLDAEFGPDVFLCLDPLRSVARRSSWGGTAPQAVAGQIQQAREELQALNQTKI